MKKLLSLILVAIMLVTAMPAAMAEGNTYKVGDIIQFGSYPQSEVKDATLVAELNALAPEWEDWTSYDYYMGDNTAGSMQQGDWMRYTDVVYDADIYRGVKFIQYRPNNTTSMPDLGEQVENGYNLNTVYWFKYEPIEWRILDPETGLVMCETIIDAQSYSDTIYYNYDTNEYFNDDELKYYANDYATSSIRKWLNNDFCQTAFSSDEMNYINLTTLNNDGYYTSIEVGGYENLDGNDTSDKVFLLSYNDIVNKNYKFDPVSNNFDAARRTTGSDYAKSQGLFVGTYGSYFGNSSWLLRTAGNNTNYTCSVVYYGYSYISYNVSSTVYGIRPALCLDLPDSESAEHSHIYTMIITDPNCTENGYTSFVCGCGDNYTDFIVDPLGHTYEATEIAPTCAKEGSMYYLCACGENYKETLEKVDHKDENDDYKCDFDCGKEFEKPPEECTCKCHKGGIAGFFFKISLFFQKLFGKNKVCACGEKH